VIATAIVMLLREITRRRILLLMMLVAACLRPLGSVMLFEIRREAVTGALHPTQHCDCQQNCNAMKHGLRHLR
jgi:hypothetical protein